MKAALQTRYDKNNDALEIQDLPTPRPDTGEVLVRVRATGVNPVDLMILHGDVRAVVPYDVPLVAGNELAGEVVDTGSGVTSFSEGDRVFCRLPLRRTGAFAEYAAVDADALALVPSNLGWEEAAAVPLAALTGMQALDLLGTRPGESVFVAGGSSSLGAMLIPLAVARGLDVYTNGNAKSRERIESLGVVRYFDYRTQDYAQELAGIDHVIDTIGGAELEREYGVLRRGGHLVSLRAMPDGKFARRMGFGIMRRLAFSMVGSRFNRQARRHGATYDFLFVHADGRQLAEAADVLTRANVRPAVDSVFEFDDVNAAFDKVAHGGSSGKTVLRL